MCITDYFTGYTCIERREQVGLVSVYLRRESLHGLP